MPTATDETAQALEARARQADQAAADLERRSAGGEDIHLADVEAHRADAKGLRFRARAAWARETQEAERQRLENLAALSAEIKAAAADSGTGGLTARLTQLAADAALIRQAVAEHDQRVGRLRARAQALGAEPAPPSGPRADSGHVAISGHGGVQAGDVELIKLRANIGDLISQAVHGQPVDVPSVVVIHPPVDAPRYAVLGARGGVIHAMPAIDENLRSLIDVGDLILLTDAERAAWWAGTFDATSIDVPARAAAQLAAAKAAEAARWEEIRARHRERIAQNEQRALDAITPQRSA